MQLKLYDKEDISGIRRLFKVAFNGDITADWLLWKYERSPWGTKGYVAVYEGDVIAFYGGIRLQFDFKDAKLWAYQLCDVMTHPGYRAKLFSKTPVVAMLGELLYKENEMDFAFGFPSLRHARLQSLRLGGEGFRLIRQYKKNLAKKPFLLSWINVDEGWDILNDAVFERMSVKTGGYLKLVKNSEYIKWRYVEHPLKKYKLVRFKRFGTVKGYIIFNVQDDSVSILELFFNRISDLKYILPSFENYIAHEIVGCRNIKAWCHANDPIVDFFERSAYISDDHIPIAFKSVNKECDVNSEVFYERFFYRMGDYDAS